MPVGEQAHRENFGVIVRGARAGHEEILVRTNDFDLGEDFPRFGERYLVYGEMGEGGEIDYGVHVCVGDAEGWAGASDVEDVWDGEFL